MDERSWDECRFPQDMLSALLLHPLSARKSHLFACACCLPLWSILHADGRRHLLTSERAIEYLASREEIAKARTYWERISRRHSEVRGRIQAHVAMNAWVTFVPSRSSQALVNLSRSAAEAQAKSVPWPVVRLRQAVNLRDIVGNPFRPTPPVHRDWLAWENGLVPSIAQAAYDARSLPDGDLDPVRLAVLADALEDAGCDDARILLHLRDPVPHVRGCWLVDRLLGYE